MAMTKDFSDQPDQRYNPNPPDLQKFCAINFPARCLISIYCSSYWATNKLEIIDEAAWAIRRWQKIKLATKIYYFRS